MKNDWKNLNEERPCTEWICDTLLPDRTVVKNVEVVKVEDDEDSMPEADFKKYLEATHFRKSE